MDFLTEYERQAFDRLKLKHPAAMVDFCTFMFHIKSPHAKEKRYMERIALVLDLVDLMGEDVNEVVNEGVKYTKVLNDWFEAYGNDLAEYHASLTIKVKQLNEVLREPLELGELNADDKAKVIKLNLDAAIGVDDLLRKKQDVEGRLFSDRETSDAVKRRLASSASPEGQANV